jgi:hypothetical protein
MRILHEGRLNATMTAGTNGRSATATLIVVSVLTTVLSGCGGGSRTDTRTVTVIHRSNRTVPTDQVLSLSGLGTFHGRCPAGARSWAVRFVVEGASDTLSYRVGTGRRSTVTLDPGSGIAFHLVPKAAKTPEPADRFVPPLGQGRGRSGATSVPTTQPLQVTVYQGTEPQTLRADVRLALATIGGESGQCVLVGSTVAADTYPN